MSKYVAALAGLLLPTLALAQPEHAAGGEANLVLPDLHSVNFLGLDGHTLLMIGLLFCFGGLLFGLAIYVQLKNLPVHRSMREISDRSETSTAMRSTLLRMVPTNCSCWTVSGPTIFNRSV